MPLGGGRGCGYRIVGGAYLVGEVAALGTLPTCVEVDPPIPVDTDAIPFSRGIYLIDFDAIFQEQDQRLWLVGTSRESLAQRDHRRWEIEQYGMTLHERMRVGICAGMSLVQAELRLAMLHPYPDIYLNDYIAAIQRAGKGRRIAREVGKMQEARLAENWKALLASAWRVAGYSGKGEDVISRNVKRIMVGIDAMKDALLL